MTNNTPNVGDLISETLVFTVTDRQQANKAAEALKTDGIDESHIKIVDSSDKRQLIHTDGAPELMASSVNTSRMRGVIIGGVVGVAFGAAFMVLASLSLLAIVGLGILGAGIGALGSQLIGVSEPDKAVAEAMTEVDGGAVAVLVEVARSNHQHVVDTIHKIFPQADVRHESLTGAVAHS